MPSPEPRSLPREHLDQCGGGCPSVQAAATGGPRGCSVGSSRVKGSPITASSASTPSAERSPSRRASSCRRRSRSSARRHVGVVERLFELLVGDELGRRRDTVDLTLGTMRQVRIAEMLPMNDAVSALISTAPASAVPSDAPRLVIVFCTPPTSQALLVGNRRHRDAAELRRQPPDADPDEQHRHRHDLAPASRRSRPRARPGPARSSGKPMRDDPARRRVGPHLRHADRRDQQRERQRQQPDAGLDRRQAERRPTSTAARRRTARLARGTGRRTAIGHPASCRMRSIDGRSSGSRPLASRRASHQKNVDSTAAPTSSSQITGDRLNHDGRRPVGRIQPHVPDLQDPEHQRSRGRRSTARSRRGRGAGGSRAGRRRSAGSARGSR